MTKYLTENDAKDIWADMKKWVAIQIDSLFAGKFSGSGSGSSAVEEVEELTEAEVKSVMDLVFGRE